MADDFLNKFSKENYQKKETAALKKQPEEVTKKESQVTSSSVLKKQEIPESKTTKPKHAAKSLSHHVEHEIEIDHEYQKKRKQKQRIAMISGGVAVVVLIVSIVLMRLVTIQDFTGKNVSELKVWAKNKDITLKIEYEYSVTYDENVVISQDLKANKKVFKGKTMNVIASKGADPEESISLPDIQTMNVSSLHTWIEKNRLSNVKIVKEFSEEIEKDAVISFSFEEDVTAENYKRKDRLKIVVSKGKEVFEKNIEVPDFNNKTKAEVDAWGKTNEVAIVFEETSSDTVMVDMVVSQSVAVGEKVSKEDSITVAISTGKVFVVPNFSGVFKEDALTNYPDLNVIVKEQYHAKIGYGGLISQSVPAGSHLKEDNNMVTVVYSIGSPYIDDLTQMTEKELPEYFYNFKAAGANISYSIEYISGDATLRGTVAEASRRCEYVGMNERIHIKIYR